MLALSLNKRLMNLWQFASVSYHDCDCNGVVKSGPLLRAVLLTTLEQSKWVLEQWQLSLRSTPGIVLLLFFFEKHNFKGPPPLPTPPSPPSATTTLKTTRPVYLYCTDIVITSFLCVQIDLEDANYCSSLEKEGCKNYNSSLVLAVQIAWWLTLDMFDVALQVEQACLPSWP